MKKSTVEEIEKRFDADVERFSNLETGQLSTIDAVVSLELMTDVAKVINPQAINILDIGCGAGNYTLKMLSKINNLNCTLIDLSKPMLDRAYERVSRETVGKVKTIQGDIRNIELPENTYDIIFAGAVLHHLRNDEEWHMIFSKLYLTLNNGGCLMVSDLIVQDNSLINDLIWARYGKYLEKLNGQGYRKDVLNYIDKEDTPRSLNFQMDLMRKIGFAYTDILHKNTCFATYCGIK